MTDHAQPSGDPADDDSLAGTLRQTFRKLMQQTDDCLPAVVVAFDRVKNRATVAPCVTALTTDGRLIPRAQVASVPVVQVGGGGFVLNFPLKPGDFGWLKASDRDVSLFLQSYKTSPPNTLRLHTFQDGVFIPDVMRGWTIAGEDAEGVVLQTLDGSKKVSITDSRVKVMAEGATVTIAPGGVTIDAPAVTITGPTSITGATTITGGLVVDGITFGTHTHTDPQGGNTGGPA